MNSTFSLRRILLYARKHYLENARKYLYILLAFAILQGVSFWFYCCTAERDTEVYYNLTLIYMAAFSYLIARLSCRSHRERRQMPLAYTLPVTPLEKYLFIWFNSAVVAIVYYGVMLSPFVVKVYCPGIPDDYFLLNMSCRVWLSLVLIQSGVLLACCWAKGNPLKILLPLAVAYLLYLLAYGAILWYAFGMSSGLPFSEMCINRFSDTAVLRCELPDQLPAYGAYIILFGFWIVVCWVAAYFKFKERTLK